MAEAASEGRQRLVRLHQALLQRGGGRQEVWRAGHRGRGCQLRRIPRDASVVAIVSRVDEQIAIALGNMVRMGYGVTCLINTYESDLFAKYSGPLLSAGIQTLHLKDEETLATICRKQMVRA